MNKNSIFKKAASVISGLLISSMVVAPGVFAGSNVSSDDCHSYSHNQSVNDIRRFVVETSRELEICASKAQDGDEIVLKNDLFVDFKLYIKSSICLNLNNHSLTVKDGGVILIGDKVFARNEKYVVHQKGYFKLQPTYRTVRDGGRYKTVTEWNNVWHEPRDEMHYREIYDYSDNVNVIIKDGKIKKEKGLPGQNGVKDSWRDYNGEDGQTPSAPVEVVSGTVNLINAKIKGGEGGNGGKGAYGSLSHLFACGGDAGNGGDGGRGGYAVYLHRKECRLILGKKGKLKGGNGGEGGKAGKIHPGYWVIPGSEGCDGKEGLRGKPYNEINNETNNEEK